MERHRTVPKKKDPSDKDIEKLAAFADATYISLNDQPPWVRLGDEEKRARSFTALHYYFLLLTLRAIEDRKLAERLIPLFVDLENKAVEYKPMFGILSQILQLKHGIRHEFAPPTTPEKIEQYARRLMEVVSYDEMIRGRESLRKKIERAEREEAEILARGERDRGYKHEYNPMYG